MKKKNFAIIPIIFLSIILVALGSAFAEPLKWKMVSVYPSNTTNLDMDKDFAKAVNEICKGELEIKVYAAGELVPTAQVFDTVASGTAEMGGAWAGYWAGKNTAFNPLGALPLGLSYSDFYTWIYNGGGEEIAQEVYGKYGMMHFFTCLAPPESGLRGRKPFRKLSDFKGAKLRMAGVLQGDILTQLGASQVNVAPTEVYQALEKGILDAAEYSLPDADWKMGLQEVTTWWSTPGWHQNASTNGVMINKKAWDSLSKGLQEKIKIAARATFAINYPRWEYNAAIATTKFKNKKGQKVAELDDASMVELQKMCFAAFQREAQRNPLFAKVIYSMFQTKQLMSDWRDRQKALGKVPPQLMPNMAILKKEAEKAK